MCKAVSARRYAAAGKRGLGLCLLVRLGLRGLGALLGGDFGLGLFGRTGRSGGNYDSVGKRRLIYGLGSDRIGCDRVGRNLVGNRRVRSLARRDWVGRNWIGRRGIGRNGVGSRGIGRRGIGGDGIGGLRRSHRIGGNRVGYHGIGSRHCALGGLRPIVAARNYGNEQKR